jgi:purine nucleosidase
VTRQVTLSADEVQARFDHPVLKPVLDFSEIWFREQDTMLFHDPLAAVSIFDPDVCGFVPGRVDVNSDASAGLLGKTDFYPDAKDKPHEVALTVDADRFFASYFEVFGT